MKDQSKTKKELIEELAFLKQKRSEFEGEELQRKQTEKDLQESETLYNTVMTNLPVGVIIVDPLTRMIESVNQAASALFGAPEEHIIGHRCHSFLCPADEKACPILDLGKIIENAEREMICADGNRSPVLKSVIRIKIQGQEKLLECFVDITERKRAEEENRRSMEKLREAFHGIVQVISAMLEKRDPYTSGHQKRVAELARAIGEEMGISPDRVIGLQMAGSIHDIGKISIPSEILSKPTRLTKFEYELIQTHSQSGRDILRDVEFPWPIAEMILQHHERMDGTGYPRGLKGEEILLEARILAVSDIVEAMASHRPYRVALGIETALEEIEKNIGIAYDIEVAKACLRLFREKDYGLVG